jgi:D-alanine-D-alanine ligase-like ATP-grasp enzyme
MKLYVTLLSGMTKNMIIMETITSNYNFNPLKGYENFEATTQIIIAEILKRKLSFEVVDADNNLIAVTYNGKEYIIHEGTISDANTLISYWISNDKWMTKNILIRKGLHVARGVLLSKNYDMNELGKLNFPMVVKPFNTDHGIAVSTNLQNQHEILEAIDKAFEYSSKVIVEEYFEGREYRFLVIDYKVRAIAYRVPANITGDGQSSIYELIKEKNKIRGNDYTYPLLKIVVDDEVIRHLKEQKLTLGSKLEKGQQVFLRKNSNLSTGGDSIDVTDEMPEFYKQIAENATKAAGLKISGVDIIIKNITEEPNENNHIIVELNAPAMLSMHDYPYMGKNRNVAKYVLDCILASK